MELNILLALTLPPLAGSVIGYFTNWLAIKMLFRPYKKKTITIPALNIEYRLPFTPGLFPKEQERLAAKVAETVTQQLLTPDDIQNMTVKLITPKNIEVGVDKIVDSILNEFQNIRKLRYIAEDIAQLIAAFLKQNAPEIIEDVTRKGPFVRDILGKAFDTIILNIKIPQNTAYSLVASTFDFLATPNTIRNWLLGVLTKENIEQVNKLVQENASGPYFFISRIITIKSLLEQIRDFLKNDPESANETIQQTILELKLKDRFADEITRLDFRKLPYSTVSMLREYFIDLVIQYILMNSKQMSEKFSTGDMTTILTEKILRFDVRKVNTDTVNSIKKEMSNFITKYLEREIGTLVQQAIPALGIEAVISSKVLRFSPKQLEKIITDISHKELRGIEILGGILGFLIGVIQVFTMLILGVI